MQKHTWYGLFDWSNKRTVGGVKEEIKGLVFLKKTQPKILVNQHLTKVSMVVERNQGTKSTKLVWRQNN